MQSQGRLQGKMSRLNSEYFGNHHCGIGGSSYVDAPKRKLFDLPQTTWKCPPKFLLNERWSVAAGEDSEEAKTQKLRETRVLDTAQPYPYDTCSPHPFDVPAHLCDSQIPVIPLIPVEEIEEEAIVESDTAVPEDSSFNSLPEVTSPREPVSPQVESSDSLQSAPNNNSAADADVVAAAAAVMTAVLKSKEQGSLIDTNLLIKLLSDPQMIQKLMNGHEDLAKMTTVSISGSLPFKKPGTVEEISNKPGDPCKSEFAPKPFRQDLKAKSINKDIANGPGLLGGSKPIVLPRPNTDPRFGNSTHKLEGAGLISGPYPVTSLAFLPISRSNSVSENFPYGHGVPDHGRYGSVSLGMSSTPLPSFPSPRSNLLRTGAAAQVSGPYPITSPIPRSNPVVENYGYNVPDHRRNGSVSVGKSQSPLPPSFPSPRPDLLKTETMINGRYQGIKRQVSSPTLNLSAVSVNRFPSPNLGDTEIQMEAFSPDSRMPLSPESPGLNFRHLPNTVKPYLHVKALSPPDSVEMTSFSVKPANPAKDLGYFKDLIRRHGEIQRKEDLNLPKTGKSQVSSLDLQLLSTLKHNHTAQKSQKLCMYFNSPKGCRNGSNCSFRHEDSRRVSPGSTLEAPGAKRTKLSG